MAEQKYIERPPRIQPELPQDEVSIPGPPGEQNSLGQNLLQVALPLVTIMGYIGISFFGGGRSPLFILPMGLSVVASVAMSIYTRAQQNKDSGKKQAAYAERLVEMRREMTVSHDMQRRFYRYNYPETAYCIEIANHACRKMKGEPANSQTTARLWERRSSDGDFGHIRLGIGSRTSSVIYRMADSDFDDPQTRDGMRLAEDSINVADVPITIPLREPKKEGPGDDSKVEARPSLGIVGNRPKGVYAFTHAVLTQFVTFHSPNDVSLMVLGTDRGSEQWRWIRPLPHAAGGKNVSWCFENDDDRAHPDEKDRSAVTGFMKGLRKVLNERDSRLRDPESKVDVTLPFILLVIDLLEPLPEGSQLSDTEMDPAIAMLMGRGHELGGAVIFLVPDSSSVPSGCRSVIEIVVPPKGDGGDRRDVRFRYAETGVNSPRYTGKADLILNQERLLTFAHDLEPLNVRKTYGADLPRGVSMMGDMLKISTAAELRQLMEAEWRKSRTAEEAEWLRCSLGMMSGGDIRTLKYSADADGVHGMIAGSTGSGKSELLMTMILNMAYRYDPSIVNFVLVDFKGGGAFKPLEGLPHVVDVVTNLSESAVERMFAAITAELNRRQAINTNTDSKHIVDYRKRRLHETVGEYSDGQYGKLVEIKGNTFRTEPYPHLFVFIDEFAEMIAANPEYKAQLNSITRLGRALGVTLILAAQRPTGVTDQMRANIKFRIALRVETREESGEILRRPDAAYLPTGIPGRGYLQIGNENVELIQVAWTGADYKGGKQKAVRKVIWPDRPKPVEEEEEYPKVFEMMATEMQALSDRISPRQRKPWPDFLPSNMSLQFSVDVSYMSGESLDALLAFYEGAEPEDEIKYAPLHAAVDRWEKGEGKWNGIDWDNRAMRAVVGLVDNPYLSENRPLRVDLRRGHFVVFGASGWGKTTTLRTLITSLATTHSPRELNVYIMDFGGLQLSVFEQLPHLGAIITPDEVERINRLMRFLDTSLEERKRIVKNAGADDLYAYNRKNADNPLPALLVVIDNFAEFRESFDSQTMQLVSLARECRAYGIHFALSGELPNSLGGKLYALFTERLALKLSDAGEYSGIVGRGAREVEDIAGRGYVKVERRALQCQVALPVGSSGDDSQQPTDETQKLLELVRTMSLATADMGLTPEQRPEPIRTLVTRQLLADILPPVEQAEPGRKVLPVVGIEDIHLGPWEMDLEKLGPNLLVMGPPIAGKTTTLRSMVIALANNYSPEEAAIVLIDMQRRFHRYGGKSGLDELPHVLQAIDSEEQLESFVASLKEECANLDNEKRRIFIFIDNYDSFSEEADALRKARILPQMGKLSRERGADGLHVVIAGSMSMPRDSLRKQVQANSFGLSMQSAEGAQNMNAKVPRSLLSLEQPIGRGFLVKSGRVFLLQVASPIENDETAEDELDSWVKRIRNRYDGMQVSWRYVPDEDELEQEEEVQVSAISAETKTPPPPPSNTIQKIREKREETTIYEVTKEINVKELKKKLEDNGISDLITGVLSKEDIYNMAISMGLVEAPEQ